jgi:hypothetical protein
MLPVYGILLVANSTVFILNILPALARMEKGNETIISRMKGFLH